MALSKAARKRIEVAVAHRALAKEIADALDVGTTAATPVADVAAANAVDLATTQTLANELKTKLNALLAAMRVASQLQP